MIILKKKSRGFLLVELMIAIFILVVCFLIILGVFPTSYKAVKKGKDILFATAVARRQVERVIAQDYTSYSLSLTGATASYTSQVEGNSFTTEFIYNVTVVPDSQAQVAASSIKNVVVMIYKTLDPKEYVKLETEIVREQ